MLFNKVLVGFFTFSVAVLACPLVERSGDNEILVARAAPKPPAKPAAPAPLILQSSAGSSIEAQAHAKNNAAGRNVPKKCKTFWDCQCPKFPNDQKIHSTSCIGGFCQCDNPVANLISDTYVNAAIQIGNSKILNVLSNVFAGLEDVKELIEVVASAFLPPAAKYALKVAFNAIPDFGPSHLDQLTKGALNKILS